MLKRLQGDICLLGGGIKWLEKDMGETFEKKKG